MHAYTMKDKGINAGLVQNFDTSRRPKGQWKAMFGFRKMFWDYLNKLHVGFYDPCCPSANGDEPGEGITGVRFNNDTGVLEFWDPYTEAWVPVEDWEATTTTTTTTVP